MDFEVKELQRYQPFLVDKKMLDVLDTPDGRLYSQYLIEENSLEIRVNGDNFRGRDANRRKRLKQLREELIPRQRSKVFQMLRNL